VSINDKLIWIEINQPYTNVQLNLSPDKNFKRWAAFGRLEVNVSKTEILIDYGRKIVHIKGNIIPSTDEENIKNNKLDTFNFDSDPDRGRIANLLTEIVHKQAPPGSSSFNIFTVPQKPSLFEKSYTFGKFFRN